MCLVISDNILTARGKENKVEREEGGREVESKLNGASSKQQPSRALPLPPRSLPPKPLQKPTAPVSPSKQNNVSPSPAPGKWARSPRESANCA